MLPVQPGHSVKSVAVAVATNIAGVLFQGFCRHAVSKFVDGAAVKSNDGVCFFQCTSKSTVQQIIDAHLRPVMEVGLEAWARHTTLPAFIHCNVSSCVSL
jgi:hypothetical protein